MGIIKEKLLRLKQDINSVGASHALLYIKLDFIEKMERESDQEPIFRETLKVIGKLVDKAQKNIESYGDLLEIKNMYSEAFMFSKLQALLSIEKIPERGNKTPDYEVKFRDATIYIELKSLNMVGGNCKHQEIMEDAFGVNLEVEKEIRSGSSANIGYQEIQPYRASNKSYDPCSPRMVIEALIDKINQNIKRDQYTFGDTILLVDLSDQLPLVSTPSEAIQKKYYDAIGEGYASGELWYVAFGGIGDEIHRPVGSKGADNDDGQLIKEGVLVSHPYIKGILFHVNENFYAVAEINEANMNVISLLDYVSRGRSYK